MRYWEKEILRKGDEKMAKLENEIMKRGKWEYVKKSMSHWIIKWMKEKKLFDEKLL